MLNDPAAVLLLAVVAVAAFLVAILVLAFWLTERRRDQARIQQLLQERESGLAEARRESVERSRSTLKGRIAEQMAPLLPGFRYAPADARFLGDPVDYVVFSGYTGMRDAEAGSEGMEVVLLEVKQGGSALSPSQKAIAACVEEGRVRFEVCRVSEDGTVSSQAWRPRRQGPRA
jgi:predicted Holliday junction resolvase-like endonuclease